MAHFAQVENGLVIQCLVVSNDDVDNLPFPESEPVGQAFLLSLGLGEGWLETSYNANFRGRYGCQGSTYDYTLDAFYAPQPYPTWVLDDSFLWVPPVPMPSEGYWTWNEATQQWDEVADPYTV
jgi:hypothetical protein